MSVLYKIKTFLSYYLRAKTRYNVHSPFVSEFIEQVLEDDRDFYAFRKIEAVRSRLEQNNNEIEVGDYGAGSKVLNSSTRKISQIVNSSSSSVKKGRLLFKLANYYNPSSIIELGTNLGLGTLYLTSPSRKIEMKTIEGCPNTSKVALEVLKRFPELNIEVITGKFDEVFPRLLENFQTVDLIYFDGNHSEKATLNYFNSCLNYVHNNSILVFDDIYWSKGMTSAWKKIQSHPRVTLSIDLYHLGIIFFRDEFSTKHHYRLIESAKKPFSMGFLSKSAASGTRS